MLKKRFKRLKLFIIPKNAIKAEANKPIASIFFKRKIISIEAKVKLKNFAKLNLPPKVNLNLFSIKPIKAEEKIVKMVK